MGSGRLRNARSALQRVPKSCDQIKQLYYFPRKDFCALQLTFAHEASPLRNTFCKVTAGEHSSESRLPYSRSFSSSLGPSYASQKASYSNLICTL